MPTYEYRCHDCEHQFEVFQKMSDDPVSECEACGGSVRRVLFPVAIHFKGSGFYTTDYARKKTLPASNGNGSSEAGESNGNGSSGSSAASGNGASKPVSEAPAKKEAKASSKPGES